jgi:nucleoside-diphosphate-sugar epimerase
LKRVFITGGSGFFGTNLIEYYRDKEIVILNYDISQPLIRKNVDCWFEGDILDGEKLDKTMNSFRPDVVIHLAARTECDENTTVEEGYSVNTTGTRKLLDAVKSCDSVERVIVTSSQFVCGPERQPIGDEDYFPHTIYGQSKVETEILTRRAKLNCTWTLIRPVNIWGAYHERYAREFWRIASSGLYVHPDVPAPTRTYGYIGNVIWQIDGLLNAPKESVDKQVYYVGDNPIPIDQWSLGFYRAFNGREPIKLPMFFMNVLAKIGDGISALIGRPFFITSSRLKSMTIDYLSPVTKTEELLGEAPYSLEEGIEETVDWYKSSK